MIKIIYFPSLDLHQLIIYFNLLNCQFLCRLLQVLFTFLVYLQLNFINSKFHFLILVLILTFIVIINFFIVLNYIITKAIRLII